MVLTRAQAKSTASKASEINNDLFVTLAVTSSGKIRANPALSSSEDSDDDEEQDSWPPLTSAVRDGARKLREKLKDMALQMKEGTTVDNATDQQPASSMDPFSNVSTMGFEFAKSLDNTDGPGGMAVMVDSDSSTVTGKVSAFHTWQLQRHEQSAPTPSNPDHATELATMGLFALLPGELRNRIYRLVLLMTSPLPYPISMPYKTCALGPCVHARLPTAVPGLLSSCRQIRSEAMPIFLAENTGFKFEARVVECRCPANWIRALGRYTRLIKTVVLEVNVFRSLGAGETHDIELTCPQSAVLALNEEGAMLGIDMGGFGIRIADEMKEKAPQQCEKIRKHVLELNGRLTAGAEVRTEEVLREFVGSDWLADVVWKCKK
jgi:hypothetical protein